MSVETVVILNDHAFINGGQAKVAIDSAISLSNNGTNVIFFAPCGPVDNALLKSEVRVICLDQDDLLSNPSRLRAALEGLWSRSVARALKALLDTLDPSTTIIHAHGFAKALSPSIGPLLTEGPILHVFTMHECFLACPNGAFFDFQKNELCERKALSLSCLMTNCDARHPGHKAWRVMRQLMLWYGGRLPSRLRHVIYLSETQHKVMVPYLHPDTILHHILNPVGFEGAERVKVEGNNIALFIGRLTPEKGCMLFAKAAKKVGIQAVFVGDGEQAAAIKSENPDAVITGWLTPQEVELWLNKARYLVFPSLLYEAFGLVAYEAMSKGVPVICGVWNAASAVVKHEKTGLLVQNRTPSDWVAALKKLQSDKIVGLSKNAFESYRVLKRQYPPHHEALTQLYNKIVEE